VLDDENRVAHIAQLLQGCDEADVVALVQPDRWFIQDVEDADEAGADLRGETDALALAPERVPAARSRSGNPYRHRGEMKALFDLLHDPLGYGRFLPAQGQEVKKSRHSRIDRWHTFVNIPCRDRDGEAFLFQPRP